MPDQLLTVTQVAEMLDIDRKQIGRWIRSGELRGVDLSGKPNAARRNYRVRESDVEAFLAARDVLPDERPVRRRSRKPKADTIEFIK